MMLTGFFFLLFLTACLSGGNASGSELHDEQKSNHIFGEMPGGNTAGLEARDQQASNHSSEETPGGDTSSSEETEYPDEEDREDRCTFDDVVTHLNLTSSAKYTSSRPNEPHHKPTIVALDVLIHSILDVKEKDQQLMSHIHVYMRWENDFTKWSPEDFCGIEHIIVPTTLLWMPDLTIKEIVEKDKTDQNPYLRVGSDGWVEFWSDHMLISTCKMNAYKFPFDIQRCNISFKSFTYSGEEVKLHTDDDPQTIAERSRAGMNIEYEWLLINLTSNKEPVKHVLPDFNQDTIVFTITIQRSSILYTVNFLLPVLFFLSLDLASFLISDTGGEKISFKVTMLLAITVMQLILHDILPSSSDSIPLIGIYLIGTFFLMLLSLLETILVVHLIEKDSTSQDNETDSDQSLNGDKQDKANVHSCLRDMKKCFHWAHDVSADETPSVAKEGSSSQLIEVSLTLEKVSDDLVEVKKAIGKLSSKDKVKPGYWSRKVKIINKIFFVFFVAAVTVFLAVVFSMWFSPEDKY